MGSMTLKIGRKNFENHQIVVPLKALVLFQNCLPLAHPSSMQHTSLQRFGIRYSKSNSSPSSLERGILLKGQDEYLLHVKKISLNVSYIFPLNDRKILALSLLISLLVTIFVEEGGKEKEGKGDTRQ